MNNKEYELIVENWRAFLNESTLDEGMIDSIKAFISNKISSTMKKFNDYINQNSIILDQDELSKISAQSKEFKQINDGIIKVANQLKIGVDETNREKLNVQANQGAGQASAGATNSTATKASATNEAFKRDIKRLEEQYEKIENLLKEDRKQYNEFIDLAAAAGAAGIGLGGLGLSIMILKGLILLAQKLKFKKTAEIFKLVLQGLEYVEQLIRNFISRLKIFDVFSYTLLSIFLLNARKNPGGKLYQKFAKAGITLLLQRKYKIPPIDAMLDPDNFPGWKDIGDHIKHTYPRDGAHDENVHEKKSTATRDKERKEIDKKIKKISTEVEEQLKKETKILVSINQKIIWYTILGGFAVYGVTTLLNHGIHGLLGGAEAVATAVKFKEVTGAVAG